MARTAAASSGETSQSENPTEPKKTLRSRLSKKHVRYAATSVVTVLTGQSLLALAFYAGEWKAQAANLFSFSIATTVGYLINRYWTWEVSQRSGLAVQGLWFWGLSLVGLGFSLLAVRAAESLS
ncbi:MAG: GtrA family protein, partial [Actinomycetota bacterium]